MEYQPALSRTRTHTHTSCTVLFSLFSVEEYTSTYRVDLDQIGVPGVSRDSDIVVAQFALVGGTVDVSNQTPKRIKR